MTDTHSKMTPVPAWAIAAGQAIAVDNHKVYIEGEGWTDAKELAEIIFAAYASHVLAAERERGQKELGTCDLLPYFRHAKDDHMGNGKCKNRVESRASQNEPEQVVACSACRYTDKVIEQHYGRLVSIRKVIEDLEKARQ